MTTELLASLGFYQMWEFLCANWSIRSCGALRNFKHLTAGLVLLPWTLKQHYLTGLPRARHWFSAKFLAGMTCKKLVPPTVMPVLKWLDIHFYFLMKCHWLISCDFLGRVGFLSSHVVITAFPPPKHPESSTTVHCALPPYFYPSTSPCPWRTFEKISIDCRFQHQMIRSKKSVLCFVMLGYLCSVSGYSHSVHCYALEKFKKSLLLSGMCLP